MKRKLTAILLCLVLTLALFAGCSDNADPGTSGSPDGGQTNTQSPTDSGNDEEKYGGEVVIQINQSALNECFAPACQKGAAIYLAPALEPLGRYNEEGEIEWFLAESVEPDTEDKSVTIKVREGITFSDGSVLNAEVVGWNMEQYLDNGNTALWSNPSDWELIDEYTLKIYWETFTSDILDALCLNKITSKAAYEENGEDWCMTHPIGTGAFVMTELLQGNSITFERRDDYWQEGLPYLDKITYVVMNDTNTQMSSFTNGEVQAIRPTDGTLIQQLEAAGYENRAVTSALNCTMNFLACSDGNPESPFSDLKVRQAIYYAIDVEGIVESLYSGTSLGVRNLALEGMWNYVDESVLPNQYTYDVEKAKELMAESGYPDGFSTTFYPTATDQHVAVSVAAALEEIGIDMQIQLLDNSVKGEMTRNEMFEGMVVTGGAPNSNNPYNWFGRMFGPESIRVANKIAGGKYQSTTDALFACAAAFTPEAQQAAGEQLAIALNENLSGMPWRVGLSYSFEADELHDTGILQTATYESTPEIMWLEK